MACENSRLSSLLDAGDVSPEGSSAPQREKFHTDDVSQSLHNLSGSHGVSNAICSILFFSWSIMAKFCVLLRTSSSKTQMLSLKKNIIIPGILTFL